MTFFLETDEYDSMESMGNEHCIREEKLNSFSFEGALREATEAWRNRKRYTPHQYSGEFPRNPRLMCKL